jgi:hypothetical protein
MDHIGEKNRNLLVLSRPAGSRKVRTALATELGRRARLRAAAAADQFRRDESTVVIPPGVHVTIVSLLVSDVPHIAL